MPGERKYNGNRDDDMIGDALGELQGKIIKGTLTKENAGNQYYGNYSDPKLPLTKYGEWYVKKDVGGMPSYGQQKGRGTPRVILLIKDGQPTGKAYFSPHYEDFETLGDKFFKRAEGYKKLFS
jgi:hypothetical protein